MKITSEEIARLANVSRSTVSRVINNYSNVPEETRKKVMDVVKEYGYEPNSFARVLAGKAKQEIALFISDYNLGKNRWRGRKHPYFLRLIAELISQSKRYEHIISVFIVSKQEDYRKIENLYLNREISGGIFIGFEFEMDSINQLIAEGFNMVVIDPESDMMEAANVKGIYSENENAGYLATRYLLDAGHRRIAHIAGDHRLSSRDRMEGYLRAMREYGIPEEEVMVLPGNFESDEAYEAALKILNQSCTAVFASNDMMAIAAIRAANSQGIPVPKDFAVVGCDYDSTYEDIGYHLTSVEISIERLSRAAVEAVLGIEKKDKIYCKATLVKGSTA